VKLKIKQIEGRSYPVIFCDICDQEITEHVGAEYLIPDLKDGDIGDAIVGHTRCTKAYEKRAFEKDGTDFGNMGLDNLLVYLANNLKVNFSEASARTDILSNIG
jgi:hypothetical protein